MFERSIATPGHFRHRPLHHSTRRLLVAYSGAALDPSVTYEVVYEVRGGEDGPVTNNLTVTGDTSSVDDEEMVSTKSRSTRLTVVVTDVLGQ